MAVRVYSAKSAIFVQMNGENRVSHDLYSAAPKLVVGLNASEIQPNSAHEPRKSLIISRSIFRRACDFYKPIPSPLNPC